MITVSFIILAILFTKVIPKMPKERRLLIRGTETIPLNSYIDNKWLESVDLIIEDGSCTGQVAVVIGTMCSSLPIARDHIGFVDQLQYVYALPGSILNLMLTDLGRSMKNVTFDVWFTHTLEAFNNLNNQLRNGGHMFRCDSHPVESTCYNSVQLFNDPISFHVPTPGYYSLRLTNIEDSKFFPPQGLVEWSYFNQTYNFSAIVKGYSLIEANKFVEGQKPVTIKVSRLFKFVSDSCILLNFNCPNQDVEVSIQNSRARKDTFGLLAIAYILCLVMFCAVFAVTILLYWKYAKF